MKNLNYKNIALGLTASCINFIFISSTKQLLKFVNKMVFFKTFQNVLNSI